MAEFDKLEISIETDASKAASAINTLSKSLENLDNSLNLKNANNLISALESLRGISIPNIGDIFNGVDLSGINASTKELATNISAANKSAQELLNTLKNLKTGDISDLKDKFDNFNSTMSGNSSSTVSFKEMGAEARNAGNIIQQAEEEASQTTDTFRGTIEALTEAMENLGEQTRNSVEEIGKLGSPKITKVETKKGGNIEGLASLKVISDEANKVSEIFNKIGDTSSWIAQKMAAPLKAVVNEYKEKLEKIGGYFEKFRQKAQDSLKKLSAFWKRVMKTFTFMLVRKAITAIIGEIKEATESLALFSQEMGTAFNENLSNAIADLKWIGKAIVGAFEPIINYVVPVLNVLSAALVKVITLLGEFFAALTGQGYYMVAKKKVNDYADSLKKAAKEAKKSIRPFDELNLITSGNNKNDDNGLNPMEDWDMKPVSDKMKKLADKIKEIAKKLFEPIKKAWDRTKDYVISGFKYMVSELGKLFKSIGRDFLKVWQQEATVKIFENIFKIVGDIERVIGNLAKRFREAWDEGDKGLHIFENIRDIIGILIQHVRNVTEYMVEWSDSIDFNPLLESVERLTRAFKKVADFIGGVFEDVMKNVVLKYIKWLAEEGTPHLFNTIAEIIDAIDWEHLRRGLFIVEQAIEKLLENIHTGVTNAIGFLGKAFADWVNSEKFTKFMQALANIMNQITAERVEKVLEGVGLAILHIAESLADFVSSDKFQSFIESIGKWIDNHSAEDIAAIAEKIIALAGACKLIGSLIGKMSGFFGILYKITTLKMGNSIIKGLAGLGKKGKAAGESVGLLTKLGNTLQKLSTFSLKGGLSKMGTGLATGLGSIKTFFTADIGTTFAAGGATAGATFIAAFIGSVAAAIGGWNFGQWLDKKLNGDEGMGSFKEQMQGVIGAFTDGSWKDALKLWGEDISSAYSEIWADSKAQREGAISDLNKQLSEAKANMKSNWEGVRADVSQSLQTTRQEVTTNWTAISTEIKTTVAGIKTDVSTNWQAIKTDVSTQLNQIKTDAFAKWTEIKENASSKLTELKTDIQTKWTEIKSFFNEGLAYIKAKFANFSLAGMGSRIVNSFLSGLRSAWQSVSSFIHSKVEEIKSKFNLNFSFDFSGNGGGIRAFATGGFPEDGTFFRASHGEMIGEFDNGQSVVANNQQIVDGIKAGVIDGMMQILPSLAQAVGGDTNVVIEGDMSKMFRAMVKENYGANKRTFNASPLYS